MNPCKKKNRCPACKEKRNCSALHLFSNGRHHDSFCAGCVSKLIKYRDEDLKKGVERTLAETRAIERVTKEAQK